jgi:hypothetical protein
MGRSRIWNKGVGKSKHIKAAGKPGQAKHSQARATGRARHGAKVQKREKRREERMGPGKVTHLQGPRQAGKQAPVTTTITATTRTRAGSTIRSCPATLSTQQARRRRRWCFAAACPALSRQRQRQRGREAEAARSKRLGLSSGVAVSGAAAGMILPITYVRGLQGTAGSAGLAAAAAAAQRKRYESCGPNAPQGRPCVSSGRG